MSQSSFLTFSHIRTAASASWSHYLHLIAQARSQPPIPLDRTHVLLLSTAIGLFLIGAAAYLLEGHHAGFLVINNAGRSIPDFILQTITVWGDGVFVLCLALLFLPKNLQAHWGIFVAAIIGGIVSNVLKDFFSVTRPPGEFAPELFNLVGKGYTRHSFPSGHSLTAFLAATLFIHYLKGVRFRWLFIVAAGLAALSRVLVGVHWPLDTLVGSGLGIVCGLTGIYIAAKTQRAINLYSHGFVLFLLITACVILLIEKNDYRLTLPILYIAALFTLWKTFKLYFVQPAANQFKALHIAPSQTSPKTWFFLILGVLTLYRLIVIFQPHLGLFYDEAYYYHWALNPDFGYYSKPPMVAWAIIISTTLVGDSVFGIKCMAALLYAGSAVFIYKTAEKIVDDWAGLIAGAIFLCIPMVGFNSVFITTDAPMFFFWSAALYLFILALESNKLSHWMLLGVATGCGMLSKYTMGALPLGLFLFLLFNASTRPRLVTVGPWAAAIIAGLFFSLNIIWNMTNDWVALHHTQEISQASENSVSFGSLFGFLGTQLVIFGPVWSFLVMRVLCSPTRHALRISKVHLQALLFAAFTILVAISLQAFLSRAFANWAGPWMIGGAILSAVIFRSHQLNKGQQSRITTWLIRGAFAHLALLSAFFHYPHIQSALDVTPTSKNDPYHRIEGWKDLGLQLRPILEQYPNAKLTSESRDILAYLGYYAAPGSFNFARWNSNADNIRDYYDLKVNLREWQGENHKQQQYVFVTRNPLDNDVLKSFHSSQKLAQFTSHPYVDMQRDVNVYLLTGFKGYPKPANQVDAEEQ